MINRITKRVLHGLGLEAPAERIYFDLRLASLALLRREINLRRNGAPDGLPLPSQHLIFDVIGCDWKAVYYDSGRIIVDDMIALLRIHGIKLIDIRNVLDFGCGCGRLIRHFHSSTDAAMHGTDYNRTLVDWCKLNLPVAVFGKNELDPPLPYDDSTFDFVYARSVFTHLPADLQQSWLGELRRVLRPGGTLYFSMHGRTLAGRLGREDRRRFDNAQLVVTYATRAGENLCSTFASQDYVDRHLRDGFDRIAFVEGRDELHLGQDVHLMRRK